jgi:hypothetical protein
MLENSAGRSILTEANPKRTQFEAPDGFETGQLVAFRQISNSLGLTRERASGNRNNCPARWPSGQEARRDVCGHRPPSRSDNSGDRSTSAPWHPTCTAQHSRVRPPRLSLDNQQLNLWRRVTP